MATTIIPEVTTESIATTIMPDPSPSDPIEDSKPVSEPAEIGKLIFNHVIQKTFFI